MYTLHFPNETDANVILDLVIVPVKHSSGTEVTTKHLLKASNLVSARIIEVNLVTFLHMYCRLMYFRGSLIEVIK